MPRAPPRIANRFEIKYSAPMRALVVDSSNSTNSCSTSNEKVTFARLRGSLNDTPASTSVGTALSLCEPLYELPRLRTGEPVGEDWNLFSTVGRVGALADESDIGATKSIDALGIETIHIRESADAKADAKIVEHVSVRE